jgi:hypothetical protein
LPEKATIYYLLLSFFSKYNKSDILFMQNHLLITSHLKKTLFTHAIRLMLGRKRTGGWKRETDEICSSHGHEY